MDNHSWLLPLSHRNDFHFTPSPRDFIVEEIPLYEFDGKGEHLIVHIRKKGMTTWEMIDTICSHLGIKRRDMGYAGLKDKYAMTMQYISLPARYESSFSSFSHKDIKILDITKHSNKIRTGHLKGNRFSLRFKKVLGIQRSKIDSVLDWIETNGMPDYFGYQRFGTDGKNWQEGKAILSGDRKIRDRKMREFLVSAYQSYLFNNWLSRRIEISRLVESFDESEAEDILGLGRGGLMGTKKQHHFFKILHGDVMMHYPFGKIFYAENISQEAEKFTFKDRAPTGLIPGRKAMISKSSARVIEEQFDEVMEELGTRRYAWIFPADIDRRYIPEKAHYELDFILPKGAYATGMVDMLRGETGLRNG